MIIKINILIRIQLMIWGAVLKRGTRVLSLALQMSVVTVQRNFTARAETKLRSSEQRREVFSGMYRSGL